MPLRAAMEMIKARMEITKARIIPAPLPKLTQDSPLLVSRSLVARSQLFAPAAASRNGLGEISHLSWIPSIAVEPVR